MTPLFHVSLTVKHVEMMIIIYFFYIPPSSYFLQSSSLLLIMSIYILCNLTHSLLLFYFLPFDPSLFHISYGRDQLLLIMSINILCNLKHIHHYYFLITISIF